MNTVRIHPSAFLVSTLLGVAPIRSFAQDAVPEQVEAVPAAQETAKPEAPRAEATAATAPEKDAGAPIVPPTEYAPPPVEAILTRITDPVAYLDAEANAETFLFHWNKKRDLRSGDGMRQGVAGLSEIYFPSDSANVRCFGETHFFLVPSPGEHRLRIHAVRRLLIEARNESFVLELDGGTTASFSDTVLRFELDDRNHRWILQNDGPGEVRLAGPVLPPTTAALSAGHRVEIPRIVAPDLDAPATLPNATRDVWDGKTVATHGDVRVTRRSSEIEFEGTGVASVGGARLVLDHSRIRVWKPRP